MTPEQRRVLAGFKCPKCGSGNIQIVLELKTLDLYIFGKGKRGRFLKKPLHLRDHGGDNSISVMVECRNCCWKTREGIEDIDDLAEEFIMEARHANK